MTSPLDRARGYIRAVPPSDWKPKTEAGKVAKGRARLASAAVLAGDDREARLLLQKALADAPAPPPRRAAPAPVVDRRAAEAKRRARVEEATLKHARMLR